MTQGEFDEFTDLRHSVVTLANVVVTDIVEVGLLLALDRIAIWNE
jgi:hypothetical protein